MKEKPVQRGTTTSIHHHIQPLSVLFSRRRIPLVWRRQSASARTIVLSIAALMLCNCVQLILLRFRQVRQKDFSVSAFPQVRSSLADRIQPDLFLASMWHLYSLSRDSDHFTNDCVLVDPIWPLPCANQLNGYGVTGSFGLHAFLIFFRKQ